MTCICGNAAIRAGMCAACLEDMDKVADIFEPLTPQELAGIHTLRAASQRWRGILKDRRQRHAKQGNGACDESCTCCATCYRASGLEICDRLCEHKDTNHDPEDEE